jgi:hypothetical protein
VETATSRRYAAILDAVYLHEHQLDDKIFQQLSSNVLVDAHTMLDAEDRQDIMLDTNKSFAYQEDGEKIIVETANLTIVLDDLPSIKPPKPSPTPPSVVIPPNMSFNASLPRQQLSQMGWSHLHMKRMRRRSSWRLQTSPLFLMTYTIN